MSVVAEPPTQIGALNSQDIELLLAASGAIDRLLAERNALCTRVETLERELHQTTLVHECYRKITTEFVTQFQLIDRALFLERFELADARPSPQQPFEAVSIQFPPAVAQFTRCPDERAMEVSQTGQWSLTRSLSNGGGPA